MNLNAIRLKAKNQEMKKRKYIQPRSAIVCATVEADIMVNIGSGDTTIPLAKPSRDFYDDEVFEEE